MKDKVICDLLSAKERLLKTVDLMPEGTAVDKWSKKEILAHIAGWYEEGVDATPKILHGEKPASFQYSVDGYNKRSVEKRKDKTILEIFQEMNDLHSQFIEQIKNLTDEQIAGHFGTRLGNEQINVLWMINECISHDNAHAKELEQSYN